MSEVQEQADFPWPYQIRRSGRAKRFIVKLSACKGVEVIYPRHANRQQAVAFMLSQRDWVEKRAHYYPILSSPTGLGGLLVPHELVLSALDRWYDCQWHRGGSQGRYALQSSEQVLTWSGSSQFIEPYLPALRQWLKQQATAYLEPIFHSLAAQAGFEFSKVSWRFQKTLWGSCNHKKAISLNVKLLFLPYEVVRYVMIHELCHTRYLSHCRQFWRCVAQHDVDYQAQESYLRKGIFDHPSWVGLL